MRVLVVYAHPVREGSHNFMVQKEVEGFLKARKIPYSLIDLYRDGFDPNLPELEWADHKHPNEQIAKYQKMIKDSDVLVFIYPVWWYTYPAILKGFFDRVFTAGFAYNFMKEPLWINVSKRLFGWFLSVRLFYPIIYFFLPLKQHLRGKKALVVNTYGGDEAGFRFYGHAPQYAADRAVLEFCGIKPVLRVNWYNTRHADTIPENVKGEILSKLSRLAKNI